VSNAVATVSELKPKSLPARLGERFGLPGAEVIEILKATAFKVPDGKVVTDAQIQALMVVADQYHLNPFTKEIYAFPDEKRGGIVPVVSVDGWARIINEHPQFDGMEFEVTDASITCIIYRKDRTRPTKVTEYMSECKRVSGPWVSHPKRMLRHKSLIQCARYAFGFAGIFDEDEAERIIETDASGNVKRVVEMPRAKVEAVEQKGVTIEGEVVHDQQAAPAAPEGEAKPPITENMLKVLTAKLSAGNKTEEAFCEAFKVPTIASLTTDRINDALAWATE